MGKSRAGRFESPYPGLMRRSATMPRDLSVGSLGHDAESMVLEKAKRVLPNGVERYRQVLDVVLRRIAPSRYDIDAMAIQNNGPKNAVCFSSCCNVVVLLREPIFRGPKKKFVGSGPMTKMAAASAKFTREEPTMWVLKQNKKLRIVVAELSREVRSFSRQSAQVLSARCRKVDRIAHVGSSGDLDCTF